MHRRLHSTCGTNANRVSSVPLSGRVLDASGERAEWRAGAGTELLHARREPGARKTERAEQRSAGRPTCDMGHYNGTWDVAGLSSVLCNLVFRLYITCFSVTVRVTTSTRSRAYTPGWSYTGRVDGSIAIVVYIRRTRDTHNRNERAHHRPRDARKKLDEGRRRPYFPPPPARVVTLFPRASPSSRRGSHVCGLRQLDR